MSFQKNLEVCKSFEELKTKIKCHEHDTATKYIQYTNDKGFTDLERGLFL